MNNAQKALQRIKALGPEADKVKIIYELGGCPFYYNPNVDVTWCFSDGSELEEDLLNESVWEVVI